MLAFALTPIAQAHVERNGWTADDMLGLIPHFLSEMNPAGAVEQIDAGYRQNGGGWRDTSGFTLDVEAGKLTYPGDEPRRLVADASLRDEPILFFDGAWIAVVQPDGAFRVARID